MLRLEPILMKLELKYEIFVRVGPQSLFSLIKHKGHNDLHQLNN